MEIRDVRFLAKSRLGEGGGLLQDLFSGPRLADLSSAISFRYKRISDLDLDWMSSPAISFRVKSIFGGGPQGGKK